MFEIQVISESATEPVTLSEVKDFCRLDSDSSDNDTVLSLLIASAREKLEGYLNLYFIAKVVKIEFTSRVFDLPYGPAGAITQVTSQIDDEAAVILTTDQYYTDGLQFKTLIIKDWQNDSGWWWYPVGGGWPVWQRPVNTRLEKYVVSMTTGYTTIPKALKHALLLQIDYDYKWQGKQEKEDISPAAKEQANRFGRNLPIQ